MFWFLFLAAAGFLTFLQWPLYSSNQNAYFAYGLARAGYGILSPERDVFLTRARQYPLFDALVTLTYKYLDEYAFYIYHALLIGAYLYAMIGIVSHAFDVTSTRARRISFLTAVLFVHSAVLGHVAVATLGFDLTRRLTFGYADLALVGPYFEPSVFGVFLATSLHAYLRGNPYLAVVLAVLAPTIHPGVIVGAAILVLAFMVDTYRSRGRLAPVLCLGGLALVLVAPITAYVYANFGPTSPEIQAQAQAVTMKFVPAHADPSVWFRKTAVGQTLIMVLAIILGRRTRLSTILLVVLASVVATLIVWLLTTSNAFALLYPWRITAVLVPLSTCLLLGFGVAWVFSKVGDRLAGRWERLVLFLGSAVITVLAVGGVVAFRQQYQARKVTAPHVPMMNYVRETKSAGDLYLIPPNLEDFRLYTGANIFVTGQKDGSFKDVETLDWYDRLQQANDYYETNDSTACEKLRDFHGRYGITHVVIQHNRFHVTCEFLEELYRDERYKVCAVRLPDGRRQ